MYADKGLCFKMQQSLCPTVLGEHGAPSGGVRQPLPRGDWDRVARDPQTGQCYWKTL